MEKNTKQENIVLITEKPVKYLSQYKEKIFNISGTFIPFYDESLEEFRYTGEIIQKIINLKKVFNNNLTILIGYDLDENGQFLAEILKNELLKIKISEENIFRTPLTEKNFIVFDEFIDLSKYMKYRKLDVNFIKEQKKRGVKNKLGLLKVIGISFLLKRKNAYFKPNNGTSTFTFLYKNKKRNLKDAN